MKKGVELPVSVSQVFSTATDNQSEIVLHFFAGTALMTAQTRALGSYKLIGLIPLPRGEPKIQITFTADQHNYSMIAVDLDTGKQIIIERGK